MIDSKFMNIYIADINDPIIEWINCNKVVVIALLTNPIIIKIF